jgi:hypothetical protein
MLHNESVNFVIRYLRRLNGSIYAGHTFAPLLISFHCIGNSQLAHPHPASSGTVHPVICPIMSITTATSIMEILAPIAEAIPILGTPVKGALEATSKILKYADVCTHFSCNHGMQMLIVKSGGTIE